MIEPSVDRILIVEDDPIALRHLGHILQKEKRYKVKTASKGQEALLLLEKQPFDLVLTDLVMDPVDGLQVLAHAKEIDPEMQVIIMTGYASVSTAIKAMKNEAFHYLQKPFNPDEVRHVVALALEKKRLRSKVQHLQHCVNDSDMPRIIGVSREIMAVKRLIRQVAVSDSNVLVSGGSGTGKELVASAIHKLSHRAQQRFLPINCASFAEELLANELFGHEKDAFTGASCKRSGLLEAANNGTIFFDEVGDMPLSMQAKLLRVVQERELIRVGGSKAIKIDVRIISATNKDLKMAVSHGTFRQDLYYRLNVVPINMPSLAQRKEDIPLLIKHFLDQFNQRSRNQILGFSKEAMDLLCSYEYPGNVRELENIIERAATLSKSEIIEVDVLPNDLKEFKLYSMHNEMLAVKTLEEMEREYITKVLTKFGQNKSKAAEALGINRVSLYRKLKKNQIVD